MTETLGSLRRQLHTKLGAELVRCVDGVPNFADRHSDSSSKIARRLVQEVGFSAAVGHVSGQKLGSIFQEAIRWFLEASCVRLAHLRPGRFQYLVGLDISYFAQYRHLQTLGEFLQANPHLRTTFGCDYVVTPDIVIARLPVTDEEINACGVVVSDEPVANLSLFRARNQATLWPTAGLAPFLHASISCKWTIRSDRAQNTRTEALNLIRHRKGPIPHVVAVTMEPLPTRLASLALGTGDLDCVYHPALPELRAACEACGLQDQLDVLNELVDGQRLRDIGDLPLDLAI